MLNICNFAQEIISRPIQTNSLPLTPAANYRATNSTQLPEEDTARSPSCWPNQLRALCTIQSIECRNEL